MKRHYIIIERPSEKAMLSATEGESVATSPQGGEKMNKYELMFIIDPSLTDEQKAATVETVKGIIGEANVLDVDEWGEETQNIPMKN